MGLRMTARNMKFPEDKAAQHLHLMLTTFAEIVAARQMLAMSALGH